MKEVISMSYSSKSSLNPWGQMLFDLIFTMRDIYINSGLNPLTKFNSSSRSDDFKDTPNGTSLKLLQRPSSSTRE